MLSDQLNLLELIVALLLRLETCQHSEGGQVCWNGHQAPLAQLAHIRLKAFHSESEKHCATYGYELQVCQLIQSSSAK